MIKCKYFVTYKVRPNKKLYGIPHALNMTVAGKMEDRKNQLRVISTLSRLHRVNPDAIELDEYELISSQLAPIQALKDKVMGFFKRARFA